jgi:hypothetical protein
MAQKPEPTPFQAAAQLHADGKLTEALEAYREIYRRRPNPTAALRIVKIHEERHDEAASRDALDAALKDFPSDFMLNHLFAIASYKRGDFAAHHRAVLTMAAAAAEGKADLTNPVFWPFASSNLQFKGRYLFVSGAARSGTTALGAVLNLSSEVLVFIERYPGYYGYSKSLFDWDKLCAMRGHPHEEANKELLKRYEQVRLIGDKRPNFALTLRPTMDRFSADEVSIVHIVRDPIEVGLSFERRAANQRDAWPSDRGFAVAIEEINWNNYEILRALQREDWARSIRVLDYAVFWRDVVYAHDLYRWLGLSVPVSAQEDLKEIYNNAKTIAVKERQLSVVHQRVLRERHDREAHERILAYAASARARLG